MDLITRNKLENDIDSLHPPSFFKSELSKHDFEKQLDRTMQLYVMKNKSTDANIKYKTGLTSINDINDSLIQVDSGVKKEIIACNKIIGELDSEINQLKQRTGPDKIESSSSKQRVADYADNYKTKLYIFIIKFVHVIVLVFFIIKADNYITFFVVILLFIVIQWLIKFVRRLFRRYPHGPTSIKKIDSSIKNIDSSIVTSVTEDYSDTCMGKECCDVTTKWVPGTGCVKN